MPSANFHIRPAIEADVTPMLGIYSTYVETTAASFELVPPSREEFAARLHKYQRRYQWLVAEAAGEVLGYAYGSTHRERPAYQFSVETTVYVAPAAHGRGIGRGLYEALFTQLRARGYCNAYAGVTLPNPASLALHHAVGFAPIGTFPKVGYKFGRWHDVAWLHLPLRNELLPSLG